MTIRRNIDLSAMSDRLWNVQMACDNSATSFPQLRDAIGVCGEQCDDLIKTARSESLGICNCDGIREVEALMFDLLARNALPDLAAEIEMAEFYAQALTDRNFEEQNDLVAHVQRNEHLLKTLEDWKITIAERSIDDEPVVEDDEERFGLEPILGNTDY